MPCAVCEIPALTTLNVVQSYISTHPHVVDMWIVDDYANTTCAMLDNWKDNNGLAAATSFSDPAIDMSDYGSDGMPKVVVIAGGSHTVFYNVNDVVNPTDLQAGINAALDVIGIDEANHFATALSVSPNPSAGLSTLKFNLAESSDITVSLFDLKGQLVKEQHAGKLLLGVQSLNLDTEGFANGTYLVRVSNGKKSNYINLVIAK